jgi:hypothetical protein
MDRGGPWDAKFHRTPFIARVEFPKLAWTGRFAVHGEGNENTKDARETSIWSLERAF